MYECHLTFEFKDVTSELEGYMKDDVRLYAETHGWKVSYIDGDPQLGVGERMYLTCHSESLGDIAHKMRDATETAGTAGFVWMPNPVREKIEHIIHDPLHGLVLVE